MEQGLIDITKNLATLYPDTYGSVVFKDYSLQKQFVDEVGDSIDFSIVSKTLNFSNGTKVTLRVKDGLNFNFNVHWFLLTFYDTDLFEKLALRLRAGEPGLAISMSSYPV